MKKYFKSCVLLFVFLNAEPKCLQAFANVHSHDGIGSRVKLLSSNSDTVLVFTDAAHFKLAAGGSPHKKKIIAAILAFPFPFGFMGAHRVLLGCKPWVPVFYVATFGGCFGILPLIDFCAILMSKDVEEYENNPNVFMWAK